MGFGDQDRMTLSPPK